MEKRILNSSRIFLFIICGLIILIAVFLVGLFWGQKSMDAAYQQGYQAAWNDARELVDESGYFPPEPEEVLELYGEITGINEINKTIAFQAEPYSDNPFADTSSLLRTVAVNESTLIMKMVQKDLDEFLEEQQEYDALIAGLGPEEELPEPPTSYYTEVVGFEELEPGQSISAASLTDIKSAEEYTASQINIFIVETPEEEEGPATEEFMLETE